ncbi:MAG: Ig-like domain-containing protein [Terriglobales bacterium]
MLSSKKKVQIASGFATLLLLALAVGCKGFFVNPTLTSIAVGPSATISQGATVQETAIGTYNDGSTNTLGSGVQWSSSATDVASVSSSGLVTGNSQGTATITGAFQATSGTSSITVNLTNVTALKISPSTGNVAVNGTATLFAYATVTGESNPVDVSPNATWTVSDSTNLTITVPTTAGVGVLIEAGADTPVGEQVTVTATYASTSTLTATAKLTVIQ